MQVQPLGQEDPHGGASSQTLQYSCLENPMNRGAWQAMVHGVTKVRHDLATKQHSVITVTTILVSLD